MTGVSQRNTLICHAIPGVISHAKHYGANSINQQSVPIGFWCKMSMVCAMLSGPPEAHEIMPPGLLDSCMQRHVVMFVSERLLNL